MKNVLKVITFGFILVILIILVSYIILPKKNIKNYGIRKVGYYEILAEDKNTIDAVAIGDSLVYSSISPMEIWNDYGYTVFDCSEAALVMSDAYKSLEVAVSSQHPKIVFFEADVLFRNSKKQALYSKSIKLLKEYVPIFKYHDNWKKVLFKGFDDNKYYGFVNSDKGFKYINKTKPAPKKDYMKVTTKERKIPEGNLEVFEKMVDLCNKNGVKLVVIAIPNQGNWKYSKHLSTKKITTNLNVEFIDLNLNNPLEIDWQKESRDKGRHLNYKGAKKVSNFIGNYLKESNLFTNHKDDPKYEVWNKAYELYLDKLNKN